MSPVYPDAGYAPCRTSIWIGLSWCVSFSAAAFRTFIYLFILTVIRHRTSKFHLLSCFLISPSGQQTPTLSSILLKWYLFIYIFQHPFQILSSLHNSKALLWQSPTLVCNVCFWLTAPISFLFSVYLSFSFSNYFFSQIFPFSIFHLSTRCKVFIVIVIVSVIRLFF